MSVNEAFFSKIKINYPTPLSIHENKKAVVVDVKLIRHLFLAFLSALVFFLLNKREKLHHLLDLSQ